MEKKPSEVSKNSVASSVPSSSESNKAGNRSGLTGSSAAAATSSTANPLTRPHHVKRNKRTFKVIMIGDAGVGKTCLSFRFCNGRFPQNTEATIGVDFRERNMEINDEHIKVQLWDTAGQERFRQSMVAHYYRNVHAVVFVYDLTKRGSFTNLPHWIDEFRRHALQSPSPGGEKDTIPRFLVGNKCDCTTEIAVSTEEAQKFADMNDLPLFETSAKADSQSDHVESILLTLVHKLIAARGSHVQTPDERLQHSLKLTQHDDKAADTEEPGWCC